MAAPFGRPREHDREQIAADLLEWAKLPDSINLCKFCAINELAPSKISIWAKECANFRKAYELAKAFIGARREEMLTAQLLHVKAYDLNAKTYDFFLDEKVNADKAYDAQLKQDENKALFSLSDLKKAAIDGDLSQ